MPTYTSASDANKAASPRAGKKKQTKPTTLTARKVHTSGLRPTRSLSDPDRRRTEQNPNPRAHDAPPLALAGSVQADEAARQDASAPEAIAAMGRPHRSRW